MNTLFIFVSPRNCDNEISNLIERNFWTLDKKCQQWSVDFLFFPILFKAFGREKIYETWPTMRGLSIEEIYESVILAYSQELTITAAGIIVVRDDYAPEFVELPYAEFMLDLPSKYGKSDSSWFKFKPHTGRSLCENVPTEVIEFRRQTNSNIQKTFSPHEQAAIDSFYYEYRHRLPLQALKPYVKIYEEAGDSLSDIEFSFQDRTFRFVSYDIDLHLPASEASLFLLLLRHSEGIDTREFEKYKDEIEKYYDHFGGSGSNYINNIVHPKDTNKSTYYSKFKKSLTKAFAGTKFPIDDYCAENIKTKITDDQGNTIQIDYKYKIKAAESIVVKER